MSDQDFTKAIADIRSSIQEIKKDVRRIETTIQPMKAHKWYHHLPWMRNGMV